MNSLLRFDGPRIEELLDRVQRELGPDVSIVEANRTRKGGLGGFFAREWFEVVVDPGDHQPAEPAPGSTGRELEAAGPTDPFLALASAVDDVRDLSSTPDRLPGPAPRSEPAPRSGPVPARVAVPEFELVLAGAQRAAAVVPAEPAPAVPAAAGSGPVPPPTAPTRSVPAPATRRLRDLDLGELLAHLDAMVPAALVPAGPAPVIAVVGDPSAVGPVAAALATRLGLADTDVVVAGPEPSGVAPWLALGDPGTARSRARRWRQADRPTVVAVELSPGREGHAWAASMLRALAADQVRLVAKAWQLTDQLGAKALALGGVDGLDLVEIDAAAQPELFLELDLDVLGIDGRPATPELWAALLYERRTDERDQ